MRNPLRLLRACLDRRRVRRLRAEERADDARWRADYERTERENAERVRHWEAGGRHGKRPEPRRARSRWTSRRWPG